MSKKSLKELSFCHKLGFCNSKFKGLKAAQNFKYLKELKIITFRRLKELERMIEMIPILLPNLVRN